MENVIVDLQIFLNGSVEVLQDRIDELDSAVVNVVGERGFPMILVTVT
ncbi:hypothetical protein [Lysinibacillus sp. OL1]|nr:hypothetical protein [Lysinibacillus sp. OL1]